MSFRRRGTQLTVFQPYGPINSTYPRSKEDFDRTVGWLERVFGTDTIEKIYYKDKTPWIIVELKERKEVPHALGNHQWSEILDSVPRNEIGGTTQIFMFNKEKISLEEHGFSEYRAPSDPRLTNFRVKPQSRYPKPSWCQIPIHGTMISFALPLPPKEIFDLLIQKVALPENAIKTEADAGATTGPAWGHNESWTPGDSATQNADQMINDFWSTVKVREPSETVKPMKHTPQTTTSQVKIKEEIVEQPIPASPPVPEVKIKPEPIELTIKMEPDPVNINGKLERQQLHYLVVFNPIGFNKANPMDVSQVQCWLQSQQIFGAGSVRGFWMRCLDTRIVFSVHSTLRDIVPSLGVYRWKDCIVREHASMENKTSCVFMLREDLRSEQALKSHGFDHHPASASALPFNHFRIAKGSDIVLEDLPPDHRMNGRPITESLAESWRNFCEIPVKKEIKEEIPIVKVKSEEIVHSGFNKLLPPSTAAESPSSTSLPVLRPKTLAATSPTQDPRKRITKALITEAQKMWLLDATIPHGGCNITVAETALHSAYGEPDSKGRRIIGCRGVVQSVFAAGVRTQSTARIKLEDGRTISQMPIEFVAPLPPFSAGQRTVRLTGEAKGQVFRVTKIEGERAFIVKPESATEAEWEELRNLCRYSRDYE